MGLAGFRAAAADPMIPSYMGGKFPLSTHLAARVRAPCTCPPRPGPHQSCSVPCSVASAASIRPAHSARRTTSHCQQHHAQTARR